jgi:hypothetical protein
MVMRLPYKLFALPILLFLASSLFFAPSLYAAETTLPLVAGITEGRLSMTLTPPLFQLSLLPGATWSSTLRFTNNNSYDLVIHAFTQNFRATEDAGVSFSPIGTVPGANAYELASWITPQGGAITVKHGATINIPFTIAIPKNAEPGGHYAAIVVGTTPSQSGDGEVSVGAQLSSLVLVRVIGDVLERGMIEDFASAHAIVQTQAAAFTLQFQNTGNVHVAPQGDIRITNMFGRDRGRIAIDGSNPFGNVLPNSSRKFVFDWKGERNFFDIGRYTARVSLTFGDNETKHVYYTAHFFVLPWIPFSVILGSFMFFAWFVRVVARRYVAQAILLEEERLGSVRTGAVRLTLSVLRRPLSGNVLDLTAPASVDHPRGGDSARVWRSHLYRRLQEQHLMFGSLVVFLISFLLILFYFYQVFQSERSYQMTVQQGTGEHVVVTTSAPELGR